MKVLLIGDVGAVEGYHAGDEAMLDMAVAQLRARGPVSITVVSGDPSDTRARYLVDAVARVGFTGREVLADRGRDELLDAILATAADVAGEASRTATGSGIPARPGHELVDTIAASDAVLVTGGGNLSSSWPDHVYERAAVLLVARRFGIPFVVSGQTLGPDLSVRHRALLADALAGASLVGLRERESYELAASLLPAATPRSIQLDDAAFLPDAPAPADPELVDGYIALTVNAFGEDAHSSAQLDGLADLVHAMHALSGLPTLFLPHLGALKGTGPPTGDLAVAAALRDRLGAGPELLVAPLLDGRELASATRGAAAVVTTRYHAAVFAMSGAVPCLALYQDHYTAVKLRGALDHAGLSAWSLPIDALRTGLAGDAFAELWSRREEISSHLRSVTGSWPTRDHEHWDDVWDALRRATTGSSTRPDRGPASFPSVAALQPKLDSWASATAISDASMEKVEHLEHQLRAALVDIESAQITIGDDHAEIDRLHAAVRELDLQCTEIEAEKIQLVDEARLAEQSAEAARALVNDLLDRLDAQASDHREQIQAVHATRVMRYTARPRDLYGRVRRFFR